VPYQSGVHLQLADTAEDFAAAICRLLLQDTERRRLAAAGAAYVRQNYDWQQLAVQMLADVRTALQAHSR
jgi:glycosyltransferase involved in cell wall biosynthesis